MARAPTPAAMRTAFYLARGRYSTGVLAVPLALIPAFAYAAVSAVPPPLEPLAEAIMQRTPVNLANALLDALGPFARPAALLGAVAACLPVGGLIGVAAPDATHSSAEAMRLEHRLRWLAVAALALLAALPLAVAAAYPLEAAAALLAALLFVPALVLARHVTRPGVAHPGPQRGMSRRALLRSAASSAAVVAGALALGSYSFATRVVNTALRRAGTPRTLFRFTTPPPRRPGFPVAGMEPEVSTVQSFYVMGKNAVDPYIVPDDWTLRISGHVAQPYALTYYELTRLPAVSQYATLRCVNNLPQTRLMSTAYWTGVRLRDLLDQAGLRPGAAGVVMRAPDGYDETIPIEVAEDPATLLAYGMNGMSLPGAHGGPARLVVPGLYGFKNVKWLGAIEVVPALPDGYWASRGWTASRIHSVARIDVWRPEAGGLEIAGFAFGGAFGVSRVEVQADGGDWYAAELNTPALSPYTWVQWRITLPLPRGRHTITARMVDVRGQPQDARPTGVYPDGATGLHTVSVTV